MNPELQNLLLMLPGIIHSNCFPVKAPIDVDDCVAAITLAKSDSGRLEVGQWAQIVKGKHQGNIGLIAEVEVWRVRLLVVPCIQLQKFVSQDSSTSGKRKQPQHTLQPIPNLFNPVQFAFFDGTKLRQTRVHLYQFQTFLFDHGLLLKDFDYHSISSHDVFIHYSLSPLFCASGHLAVTEATFPPLLEWGFCEDEQVNIIATMHAGKTGTTKNINGHLLEVNLANGEGLISLSWNDVWKKHTNSSFIQVSHGLNQGQSGLVVRIEDDWLCCIEKLWLTNSETSDVCLQAKINTIFSSHRCYTDARFP